ncbi:MAG: glycosyl transferase group 1, partial [bacterium]|nr:glycosyl transferase group 1 [bacterium]
KWLYGDERGYFLASFEPKDFADKIKMALEFTEKSGRTKGRERIIKLGLDSETIARRIIAVYKKVLPDK